MNKIIKNEDRKDTHSGIKYRKLEDEPLSCVVSTISTISVIPRNIVGVYGLYEEPCKKLHVKQVKDITVLSKKCEILLEFSTIKQNVTCNILDSCMA